MLNKSITTKTILIATMMSLFLVGCTSSDQRYKREIEGNDNYLKTPELRPMIVPEGMTIPRETNEFYVVKSTYEGDVGKALDIRPPQLPIPTTIDSYATYDRGVVTLDMPSGDSFWQNMLMILRNKNISIESQNSNELQTGRVFINRGTSEYAETADATYLVQQRVLSSRTFVTFRTTSLTRNGDEITNPIDVQYYTVYFFNMLMGEMAPTQSDMPQLVFE